ncbi:hypothetical protein WN48_08011 [Eufriesea mexicana]|nr:hypothetical protein WN48_08011 [Eufriesea mexicana]
MSSLAILTIENRAYSTATITVLKRLNNMFHRYCQFQSNSRTINIQYGYDMSYLQLEVRCFVHLTADHCSRCINLFTHDYYFIPIPEWQNTDPLSLCYINS